MFNNRYYIIVDAREHSVLDFSQFIEESTTILYNSGSTRFTIKYEGTAPTYKFAYPLRS